MRRWKRIVVGAPLLLVAGAACAQGYPAKPVRMIVPFPAAGGTDLMARSLAQSFYEQWSVQFIVDNRTGAAGRLGTVAAASAAPDGYTVLVSSSSTLVVAPHLAVNVGYDAIKSFQCVALISSAPNVLAVHPSVPARTMKELIAIARARPGELNFASNGTGTQSHLALELFRQRTGIDVQHIPYKGGPPAVTDLVGGQVSALITSTANTLPHVRTGRLRALGVTTLKRIEAMPEVPTLDEAGVRGFEAVQWFGVLVPAGTPREVVTRLNAGTAKALVTPDLIARLATEGATPIGGSPEQCAAYLKEDFERWGAVVRAAKLERQ